MKIAIGSDHAGLELKNHIKGYLEEKGFEITDCGTYTSDSCNYPEFGEKVAMAVKSGEAEKGVLVCGTGVGISIAANKVKGIRAVVCSEPYSAEMAVRHNNANIVSFGARVIGQATAESIVDAFFNAEYEGERHAKRVELIAEIESRN